MTTRTCVSFYLRDGKICVYADVLNEMGIPNYIRFLLNRDGSSMIIEPYYKKEFQSIRVSRGTDKHTNKMQFRCKPLCRLLQNTLGWNESYSYRVAGRFIPSQCIAVFDLTAAEIINRTNTDETYTSLDQMSESTGLARKHPIKY